MKIILKTLDNDVSEIDIDVNCSVATLYKIVYDIYGIPNAVQRLIHEGQQLNIDNYFSDYNIQNNDTIHIVTTLLGGGALILPINYFKSITNIFTTFENYIINIITFR